MIYPKISVVIPTLNRANYLEQAILSVLSQNYPNLELTIVDGGSTDNTGEIIDKYKDQISNYISENDEGMYHAINKGFSQSTGEIMAWLNSDDLYHQRSLFTIAKVFADNNDINWISGMPSFFNADGECVSIANPIIRTWDHFLIGDYKWIQQENTFWRRTLWQKAGSKLDTHYKYAADCELWFRFFQYSSIYYVKTSLAGFRLHENQLSINNQEKYIIEAEAIYKSYTENYNLTLKLWLLKKLFHLSNKYYYNYSSKISFSKLFLKLLFKTKNSISYNFNSNKWER